MKAMRLSVRALVEYCLRSGDIDNRGAGIESMHEGARAHRSIQASMGEGYKSEVTLKLNTTIAGTPVLIHGRADGIITSPDGGLTVDEIKTTTLPPGIFRQNGEAHMAQAKCYAYMLLAGDDGTKSPHESITVQLTYYRLQSGEIERHRFLYTFEELSEFFDGLISSYGEYLRLQSELKAAREETAAASAFPYESYREGQRALAVAVYSAIDKGKRLYAQAPTGIGKTISALFPSVKALGEGKAEKIFYLTAKTVTRAVAEDAVALMAAKGLRIKSVTLRAKEKLCPMGEVNCNPEYCPRAKGHFDRVNGAITELIKEKDIIKAEDIENYAARFNVCPHEFMLDLSYRADIVICDYNHVFDPAAKLRRYFGEGENDYVLLIDEAHNLYERAREMYTAALHKSSFDKAKKALKGRRKADIGLKKSITDITGYFRRLREEAKEEQASREPDDELAALVASFTAEAGEWLAKDAGHEYRKEMLSLYYDALFFLEACGMFGGRYARIAELIAGDVSVTLFCLDPSGFIADSLLAAKAAVFFSATLSPLPYYREILGGSQGDGMLALPSPFDPKKFKIDINAGISTKYRDRKGSIRPIADAIRREISQREGNYIAYFPSYEYMREVYAEFCFNHPGINTMLQEGDMGEDERRAFLERFDEKGGGTLLGFCVLGGMFSEGVDLPGKRLIGVIIIGVGLPRLSLRRNLIKNYFNGQGRDGYDYAYTYPGVNKVLQAMGRVIRTEDDEGTALLIDTRYSTAKYRALINTHHGE